MYVMDRQFFTVKALDVLFFERRSPACMLYVYKKGALAFRPAPPLLFGIHIYVVARCIFSNAT